MTTACKTIEKRSPMIREYLLHCQSLSPLNTRRSIEAGTQQIIYNESELQADLIYKGFSRLLLTQFVTFN